jgi:hypothetical protein
MGIILILNKIRTPFKTITDTTEAIAWMEMANLKKHHSG